MVNRRRTLPPREVRNWRDRVAVAGGSCTQAFFPTRDYVRSLRCAGAWQVMSNNGLIMPFATDNFTGVMVPLIAPSGVVPSNVNFVSGDYSLATGLNPGLGNSTKYVNTNYNPSTWLSLSSAQISLYSREDRGLGSGGNFPLTTGVAPSAFNRLSLSLKLTNASNLTIYDAFSVDQRASANISCAGLISGIRVSTSLSSLFRNGSSVASTANTPSSMPSGSIWIWYASGSPVNATYDDRILSYFYSGLGLSASQETAHYTAVQALQTALGRQV